jgi:hypothetical protein
LQEGFIATSDEEIKTGDIKWHHVTGLRKALVDGNYTNQFKVIAQQDQINFSGLTEEEQKEIGWFDVEELALKEYPLDIVETSKGCFDDLNYADRATWKNGLQKAQELLSDRRFTKGEMKLAFLETDTNRSFEEFIRSLSQKSWNIELEMENCTASALLSGYIPKPKLINGKIKILKLL